MRYEQFRKILPWLNVGCVVFLVALAINEAITTQRIVFIILDILGAGFNAFAAWNWWRHNKK